MDEANSNTVHIELLEWQIKILLRSLDDREEKLRRINEDESNEDAAADAGNDLIELNMTRKHLMEMGLEAFGSDIRNYHQGHP